MAHQPNTPRPQPLRPLSPESALDTNPERTRKILEAARQRKAEAEKVIGVCEALLYLTGNAHIGEETPESLSYETRLLHMTEICDGALGNMEALMGHLAKAGRPELAQHYQPYVDAIRKARDAEHAALMSGPHGRFLRETGVRAPQDAELAREAAPETQPETEPGAPGGL